MLEERRSRLVAQAKKWLIPLGILLLGIAGLFLMSQFKTPPAQADEADKTASVLTGPVQLHDGGFDIEVDGLVVPYRDIEVSTEVAGRVASKSESCRAGRYVAAGTLLLEIDRRDYDLEVKRLKRELEQADVMVQELEEEVRGTEELLKLADEEIAIRQRELNRERNLSAVSNAADLERAEANELQARNSRRSLQNQINLFKARSGRLKSATEHVAAQLEKAELDLSRTEIRAPADGVVVVDSIEKDAYVQKGTKLLTIQDTSKIEVKCKLEMEDLFWLWNQMPPETRAAAASSYEIPPIDDVQIVYSLVGLLDKQYTWQGRLARYDGIGLDEKTRTVPCRVVIDEPRQRETGGPPALVRGMFVKVRIHVQPRVTLLKVSRRALRPGNVVWRVRDGELTIVPVEYVGVSLSDSESTDDQEMSALILVNDPQQLQVGDQVAVTSLSFVKSKMSVKASPEQPKATR